MEWKTVTAEQFCTRVTDGTHDSPKRQEVGRYLITSKHLSGSDIDFSSAYKISEEDYQKIIVRSNVEQYDILFSMIGTIGNTYRVTEEAVDYAVKNMAIFKFGGNKGDSSWFYYWLKSPQAQAYISQMQAGSTQGYLTLATLRSFPVAVPDHATQDKIVAILSSLDDKIENNNRINRNLEAQAQALFKSWFVDFEPWCGTMPEDWKEGVLGDIIDEQPKSKVQVNAAKDVRGKYPFFTSGTSIYEYTEALVSGRNVYLNTGGAAGIEFYVGEAAYSTDTWCIKGMDDFTDFLYLYFSSIKEILDAEYFEGSALKHLKKKPLKERKIIIPTHKTIDDFNKMVVPLFDIIMENYSENKRLAALRDTLLPKLMRGEIEL